MSEKTVWRFRTASLLKAVLLVLLLAALGPHFFHLAVLACGGGGSDPPIPPPPAHTLIVSISGSGSVTVNPYGTNGPSQVVTSSAHVNYSSARNVALTASPYSGWVFDKWEETGQTTAAINPYISGTKYFTAMFKPIPPSEDPNQWVYLRTTVSPSGALAAGCKVSPSGKTKHARGSEVALRPQGAGGWTFSSWDGANGDDVDDFNDPAMIVMDSDKEVTAVFIQKFVLTTSTKGKGIVTATPPGPEFGPGTTTIQIEAEPDPDGWSFLEWQKDAASSGSENPTDLVMNADKHAKAVFTKANTKSLTVTTPEGSKIKIQASPNGTSNGTNPTEPGTTVLQFTSTSTVTLQVRVFKEYRGQGLRFVRWEGDVPTGQETNNPITITVDSDKSIEPVLGETFRLKVESEGPGSVSINAPPGSQVNDNRYVAGTEIGLIATPPENFVEWEGSIGGSSPEKTVTLDSNKHVLAQFMPGAGDGPMVNINSVSLEQDAISITLAPAGLSGNLALTLIGPQASHQIMSSARASGTMSETLNVSDFAQGQYDRVRAEWAVDNNSYYDEFDFAIHVLGEYNHTCYNTPDESLCEGTATEWYAYTTANGCVGHIPACDTPGLWNERLGKPIWLEAIFDGDASAGSGMDSEGNIYTIEYLCGNTAPRDRRLRRTGEPCGSSGAAVQIGDVAVNAQNPNLGAGDTVYVHGHGTHSVTDTGGGVAMNQLDHYSGVGPCFQCNAIGTAMTIKLLGD